MVTQWQVTTLKNEIQLAYGKSLPSQNRIVGKYNVYGSNGKVGTHIDFLVKGPGIIVGRKGSVGEIVFSEKNFWPIDTTYYVVNKNHDWKFLFYFFQTLGLTELNSHSTIPGLNRENVYEIKVVLPSISEQKHIALALDHVSLGIKHNDQAIEKSQELKRAAMRELFTRGLRGEAQKETEVGLVPKNWDVEHIVNNFSVFSGGTPSRGVATYWNGGTIPWVKTTEVNYSIIYETEECITQTGLENSAAKKFPVGTLLLAMYGQGITRGKVGILGIEAACNQACAAIQPKNNKINIKYLYYFLTAQYESIRQLAHGGQQQNLNLNIVRSLAVPFPNNKDEQREIAGILESIDQKINLHKRKKAVLEELFKSLLHKLMTGEIRVNELNLSALKKEVMS